MGVTDWLVDRSAVVLNGPSGRVRQVGPFLDLRDTRWGDAEELGDIAHGQPGVAKLGHRGWGPPVCLVAEFSQGATKLEGFEGLVASSAYV